MNTSQEQHSSNLPAPIQHVSWRRPVQEILTSSGILSKPTVINNFDQLPTAQRIVETLRYNLLAFEYFVSPRGELRRWFQFNVRVFFLIGIPLLLSLPLLALLVIIAKQGVDFGQRIEIFSKLLPIILENFSKSLVLLLMGFSITYCLYKMLKFLSHAVIQTVLIIMGIAAIVLVMYKWFLADFITSIWALF